MLHTGNSDRLTEDVDNGLIDFALLVEPASIEKYEYKRLAIQDHWGVLFRANDPLTEKSALCPCDLVGLPLIFSRLAVIHSEISNWFGEARSELNIVAMCDLIGNASRLVAQGLAYAITLKGAISHLNKTRCAFRPLSPLLTASAVIVWKKQPMVPPAMARFIEEIREV